jgi:hypothetical protein
MKDFVTKEYYDDHIYIKFFVQNEIAQRMAGVIENMYPDVTVNGFVWEEIFKTYYETNNIFDFAIVEYSSTSNYVMAYFDYLDYPIEEVEEMAETYEEMVRDLMEDENELVSFLDLYGDDIMLEFS